MTTRIVLGDNTFSVAGRTVSVINDHSETHYRLPKAARVELIKLTRHQHMLALGSMTRTYVTVTGPAHYIAQLKEAVLT